MVIFLLKDEKQAYFFLLKDEKIPKIFLLNDCHTF